MKIAILIYCLRGGGAERVATYLANGLTESGHEVVLITELKSSSDQYEVGPGVTRKVIGGGQGGSLANKLRRQMFKILRLRKLLRETKPDVLVSFMTRQNNLALIASIGLDQAVVISERNDPRYNKEKAGDARLRRFLYPRASLLIAQTSTMAAVMRNDFKVPNVTTIPNPAALDTADVDDAEMALPKDYILAMGRMASQKGFDVLIRAYARSVASKTISLVIAGQGGTLDWFQQIAFEEGVADRVHFVGHIERPFPVIRNCRMFVLSSRWEGFPNVLLEAMSFGRPVISTRLPSGAHDMIEDGVNGLLVPGGDHDALAAAIDRFASDQDEAECMGSRAPMSLKRFHLPVVIDLWEQVLTKAVRGQVI